ncbi:MAG: flagella basal body P-ring formation protein FlgA [Pseudomonadota bacterium]
MLDLAPSKSLSDHLRSLSIPLGFAPIVAIMFSPLTPPLLASEPSPADAAPWTAPSAIDRAVEAFTGAPIGTAGGARAAADPRLRLAACETPLLTTWHGTRRAAVRVECQGPKPWRVFVATRPLASAAQFTSVTRSARPASPAIKRGDPITVVVRGRGFTVQQSGEALENGGIGEWIGIRTTRRGEPVRARIERPGLAIIPAQ